VGFIAPMIKTWHGLPAWPEYKLETGLVLSEALKFLGLFVRGSKVPETRGMAEVIDKAIDLYRRQEAQRELTQLNEEGERSGLDPEDIERARKLEEFLGLPHSPEPADDTADSS
jgi:hypothetical protein